MIHDQNELNQAQIFLICLEDQYILYFTGAEAILPSRRGSVSSLLFYPQTKLLYSREMRIPVPKSHFKSEKQASLNVEGTRLPLGAAQNSVNGEHGGGKGERRRGCLSRQQTPGNCQVPRPMPASGSLGPRPAPQWGEASAGSRSQAGRRRVIILRRMLPPLVHLSVFSSKPRALMGEEGTPGAAPLPWTKDAFPFMAVEFLKHFKS